MTTITLPRAVIEQALEALIIAWQQQPRWQITESMHNLRAALAQQAEHFCDTHCTWADHAAGCVRAEPVQEPVGTVRVDAGEVHIVPLVRDADRSPLKDGQPVYAAPPPRKPLTDEEILEAVGWERAEMYMKLTPNFPVEEARKETLKNARAVEAKHGIKE